MRACACGRGGHSWPAGLNMVMRAVCETEEHEITYLVDQKHTGMAGGSSGTAQEKQTETKKG